MTQIWIVFICHCSSSYLIHVYFNGVFCLFFLYGLLSKLLHYFSENQCSVVSFSALFSICMKKPRKSSTFHLMYKIKRLFCFRRKSNACSIKKGQLIVLVSFILGVPISKIAGLAIYFFLLTEQSLL